jgi:hypothetical protein
MIEVAPGSPLSGLHSIAVVASGLQAIRPEFPLCTAPALKRLDIYSQFRLSPVKAGF